VIATLLGCLPACGDGGSDAGAQSRERTITEVIREALDKAKAAVKERSGGTAPEPSTRSPIGTEGQAAFDYENYQRRLSGTIGLLERYWAEALPALGARYSSPRGGYRYYRSDQGGGPACGGEQAPPKNAFYCPVGDFIAWDESGLMIPYYVQGGDFAASFVLAHEFGHAMQVRLPRQEEAGVLRELQADCFAGAWARWVAEQQLLEAGDLDEATMAVFTARDVPGTPWTDPQAHGSGFQRTRAFGDGVEAGAEICYPAPASRWILSRS
jgi:predicted metalloprotease